MINGDIELTPRHGETERKILLGMKPLPLCVFEALCEK